MTRRYLAKFFEPRSVAVLAAGGKSDTPGATVLHNLAEAGFRGKVHAVEPGYRKPRGGYAFKALDDIPLPVDLAIIPTERDALGGALDACARRDIHAAIVLSGTAQSSSSGTSGEQRTSQDADSRSRRSRASREKSLAALAARHAVRILGPETLGVIRPHIGLNASCGPATASPGRTALIAQSTGVCNAILDWAASEGLGFSAVATSGNSVDVDMADLLDYLVDDSLTDRILLHVEVPKDARRFMAALRAAARVKPVVVLKAGRYSADDGASEIQPPPDPDADALFDAALRRCGALRVRSLGDLFAASAVLETGRHPQGDRLAVLSHSPGLAALSADWARERGIAASASGLDPARTRQKKQSRRSRRPAESKPVPLERRYAEALELWTEDEDTDGILVIVPGHNLDEPDALAESLSTVDATSKPVFLCWMGRLPGDGHLDRLRNAGISLHRTPEEGVAAFVLLARHYHNQSLLLRTPPALSEQPGPDLHGARSIIETAVAEGRALLSRSEAKAVLRAFHVPAVPTVLARSPGEALIIAENIGLPVSLTANASDCADIPATVADGAAVREVYNQLVKAAAERLSSSAVDGVTVQAVVQRPAAVEIRLALTTDPLLGPVISLDPGSGSSTRIGLPPLDLPLARDSMTRPPLRPHGDRLDALSPSDLDALDQMLVRVSEIACALPDIERLDIAPLLIDEGKPLAVDARIALRAGKRSLPRYGHLLISPYPADLIRHWSTADGTPVLIRPIRPEDAQTERDFIDGLSERARYFRFMQNLKALPPPLLARLTQIDYGREMALIALVDTDGHQTAVGVARYITAVEGESCEFAIVVADAWQRRGIGHELMHQLMGAARVYGFKGMEGDVLSNNTEMLALARKLGFRVNADLEDPGIRQVSRIF